MRRLVRSEALRLLVQFVQTALQKCPTLIGKILQANATPTAAGSRSEFTGTGGVGCQPLSERLGGIQFAGVRRDFGGDERMVTGCNRSQSPPIQPAVGHGSDVSEVSLAQ